MRDWVSAHLAVIGVSVCVALLIGLMVGPAVASRLNRAAAQVNSLAR